jgi:syntaxin 5
VEGESQPLLHQQQEQQQQMVPLQDSYMQSRAEALQNVESTIHELSNIFNQLATLVSQQGEVAIRFSICLTCVLPFIILFQDNL